MKLKLLKKRFKDQAPGTNAFELDGVKLYLKKSDIAEPKISADQTLKWIRNFRHIGALDE